MEAILFINDLNNSDCISLWGVIFSAVFSFLLLIATILIGIRQNRLQKNQNKITSNQTYRALYTCLSDVRNACNMFPYNLEYSLCEIISGDNLVFCVENTEKINNLINNVNTCKIDMELQLIKYPYLYSNLMILLYNMGLAYSFVKGHKMPSDSGKMDFMNVDTLKTIIKTIQEEYPDYKNIDIDNITDVEYKDVLRKAAAVLLKSRWDINDYNKSTYDDRVEYLNKRISMLTDDKSIEGFCKTIADYRNKIFEQKNGALEFVKEKCKLQ